MMALHTGQKKKAIKMTIQQVVGLGAAVSAAITAVLIGADVPYGVLLVVSVVTAGFGAANVYFGNISQIAKTLQSRALKDG
jgi:hypothetical protein